MNRCVHPEVPPAVLAQPLLPPPPPLPRAPPVLSTASDVGGVPQGERDAHCQVCHDNPPGPVVPGSDAVDGRSTELPTPAHSPGVDLDSQPEVCSDHGLSTPQGARSTELSVALPMVKTGRSLRTLSLSLSLSLYLCFNFIKDRP